MFYYWQFTAICNFFFYKILSSKLKELEFFLNVSFFKWILSIIKIEGANFFPTQPFNFHEYNSNLLINFSYFLA